VPKLAGVVDLEQRVAALVHTYQPQLAELVRQAVDAELARLVGLELADRSGNGKPTDLSVSSACEKVCRSCQTVKPTGEFERGRRVCRACRRAQVRDHAARAAPAETEPPQPVEEAGEERQPEPAPRPAL
jgi:hypothetical protein